MTEPVVVDVPKELDVVGAGALRDAVALWFTMGATDVVLDLRDTTFVDSAGIGALIALTKRAADLGIELRLRNVGPNPATTFAMTGARRVLRIEG